MNKKIMFRSTYGRVLSKNRLYVPKKFREITKQYAEDGPLSVTLMADKDFRYVGCFLSKEEISDFLIQEYNIYTQKIIGSRISIPSVLVEGANLEKSVEVVGMADHIGIWNPNIYERYRQSIVQEFKHI